MFSNFVVNLSNFLYLLQDEGNIEDLEQEGKKCWRYNLVPFDMQFLPSSPGHMEEIVQFQQGWVATVWLYMPPLDYSNQINVIIQFPNPHWTATTKKGVSSWYDHEVSWQYFYKLVGILSWSYFVSGTRQDS
jgi:hypothetical protein